MSNLITELNELNIETINNLNHSKSFNTLRAYKSDFEDFRKFCIKFNLPYLPTNPKTIALYLTNISKNSKYSTIKRRLASISIIHKLKKFYIDIKDPIIAGNINGIKRNIGIKQSSKKPLLFNNIKDIINKLNQEKVHSLKNLRDISILLIGFSGGFRRSEIINLNIEDLEFVNEGLKIYINNSKTDQFGEGYVKAIPYFTNKTYCPVLNIKKYIQVAQLTSGPLFRSVSKVNILNNKRLTDQSVALIIKKNLKKLNIENLNYSGHSLRSGFATSAAESGADERLIMNMTGHKSTSMVRRYIKETSLFKNNALNKIKNL